MSLARRYPWVWVVIGIVLLWLLLAARTGTVGPGLILAALSPASFLILVAIGQSLAMMTGAGNVDLSIPSVISLTAFVTVNMIGGSDLMVLPGLLVGVAIGSLVGLLNAIVILVLRIPAIIGTLASGYIVSSLALLQNHGLAVNKIAPSLVSATKGVTLGIPHIAMIAAAVAALAAFLYHRTGFGRMLLATGQNGLAAMRAGIPVRLVIAVAFVLSGGLAGLAGTLLAANAGGAFLDIGNSYLLLSIGAVVVGGTPIFGGSTTVAGTMLGALFLVVLGTTIRLVGIPGGGQEILQGAVIIAVLFMAGLSERYSRV